MAILNHEYRMKVYTTFNKNLDQRAPA